MLRNLSSILSSSLSGRKLLVLIYHRVIHEPDLIAGRGTDVKMFAWQMKQLAENYNVLPLIESVEMLRDGNLPRRAISVTFDDGYLDNYTQAFPILKKYGVHATFFIATKCIQQGIMWNDLVIDSIALAKEEMLDLTAVGLFKYNMSSPGDKRIAVDRVLNEIKYMTPEERYKTSQDIALLLKRAPRRLMMEPEHIKILHNNGMGIGAHTMTHPILAKLNYQSAWGEITCCKQELESLINAPVSLFAYPNGKPYIDYNEEHLEIVKKAGFIAAVSTASGYADAKTDLYQIPRFLPWDKTPGRFGLRLALSYLNKQSDAVDYKCERQGN